MPSGKRKLSATTPRKSGYVTSSSGSASWSSHRGRSESEDELSDSSHRSEKRPKLSTPVSRAKSRKKSMVANTAVDEIDFLAHPGTPEPTPSKTPRTKSAKTPKTTKKLTSSGLVIIQGASTPATQALTSSPSKSQRRADGLARQSQPALDPDRTPRPVLGQSRRSSFSSHPSGDELEDTQPLTSVASRVAGTFKPAVPGAARGRKKVPGRQLVREQSNASAAPIHILDSDEEQVPLESRVFAKLPTKSHAAARKALASPQKRTLANGDSYVEYMVPMASEDDAEPFSRPQSAHISASASEDDIRPRVSKGKTQARMPSRSSSVSRPSSPPSSAYTSRAPSPSPSFLRSGEEDESSGSEDSFYEPQQHVDPARNLEKLASLARRALAASEDMRRKGVMNEDEPPLPKSFFTGVVVETAPGRKTKKTEERASPSKSPSKSSARPSESGTEAEDAGEVTIIRALPERRLGQVVDEPVVRSKSWMDTVLAGRDSSTSLANDTDNPFDTSRVFKRTHSQPLPIAVQPPEPNGAGSEPSLETVLAAYDMTPSRSRTMSRTQSMNQVFGTPSKARLFGTPSRAGRKQERELEDVHEDGSTFEEWLSGQQMCVLKALRNPLWVTQGQDETEAVVKLRMLLSRTVETGEGNSCLLVGPRGSGKTKSVMSALRTLVREPLRTSPATPGKHREKTKSMHSSPTPTDRPGPIVIHLSGYVQTNDRLAMREIARQLVLQSGEQLDVPLDENENEDDLMSVSVPTATHLPQIVGALARQAKPVIVILDAFDLFAEHARQALLYCLLDTVQSCRAGEGVRGLAVVGMTSRIDCLTMLEKRVKSRFSHRIIRVSPPTSLDAYLNLVRATMVIPDTLRTSQIQRTPKKGKKKDNTSYKAWCTKWRDAVERVLSDKQFKQVLEDVFELSRDVRLPLRILSGAVLGLTPASPWLTVGGVASSVQTQCAPSQFTFLQELAYPCVALLVATQHVHDRGHDIFTFKMLSAEIKRELGNEAVTKALVQMQGRGLGLIRVPEPVLEAAFESLVGHSVLVLAGPTSHSTSRVFLKYRCVPERSDIKDAVDRLGHSALKRWFVQGASN